MTLSWLWLRRTLLSVFAILLILLALLGSQVGLQLIKFLLPAVDHQIRIGQVSGSLWQGATFDDVEWRGAHSQITLKSLHIQLGWSCLLKRHLCLDTLQLQQVSMVQAQAPATTSHHVAQSSSIQSWPVSITQLQINDLSVQLPTYQLSVKQLQSGGLWSGQQIKLTDSTLTELEILQTSTEPTPTTRTIPDWQQLDLPFNIEVSDLQLHRARLVQANQHVLEFESIRLSSELQTKQWHLDLKEFGLQNPKLAVQASLTLHKGPTPHFESSWQIQMSDLLPAQQLELRTQGPLAALNFTLALNGSQTAQLQGTVNLTDQQLPFQFSATAPNLRWPFTAQANTEPQLALDRLSISASGNLTTQQLQLSFQPLIADLPQSAVLAQLELTPAAGHVHIEQLLIHTLKGEIRFLGDYQLGTQQLQGNMAFQQLQPGLFWGDYPGMMNGQFKLNADLSNNRLQLTDVDIRGELRKQSVLLKGDLLAEKPADDWHLHTTQMSLQHGPNQLQIQGKIAEQWQLEASFEIANLGLSLAEASGSLSGQVEVSGPWTEPSIDLQLHADLLSFQQYAFSRVKLTAQIEDLGRKPSQFSLTANEGSTPQLQISQLDFHATGTQASHESHLTLDSSQLQIVLALSGKREKNLWQLRSDEARIKSEFGDWHLADALTAQLELKKQWQFALDAHCWQYLYGSLCLASTPVISPQQGQLDLHLSDIDLSTLNPLLTHLQSLQGEVSGTAQVQWQHQKPPRVQLHIQGGAGLFSQQAAQLLELPWQQFTFTGGFNAQHLTSQLDLQFNESSQAHVKMQLTELASPQKQLQADLQIHQFDLDFFQPLFDEFSQFGASLNAQMNISGDLLRPLIRGHAEIAGLHLTGEQAPIEIFPSTLRLELLGHTALFNAGLATPEGTIRLHGDADWSVPHAWFASASLEGKNLRFMLPDAEFTFSPELLLSADPSGGLLSGKIDVHQGNIQIEDLPENAIRVSEDEVIKSKVVPQNAPAPWQLKSDVRMRLGEDVQLAAFGLKTKLQGSLRIRQQGLLPTIHGQVKLIDGTFRAYGQDLTLRKGQLTFNGPADQPLMAVEAIRNPEKTEDGVIAGILVDGVSDNPVVRVFSTPAKPQANALAYLLLGRDLSSSGSDQSMTTSLIGIGIASSGKLVGQLGKVFGLQELSLDTAGSGDKSKVMVSGYLSPRLQLKYGIGIFNQLGEFTLRYRLARKLYLEAVQGLNNSVDVLYQVEFD